MFTDMKEALAAEDLELTPLGSDQHSAASLVVAHHARDKDDLADLLGALGLPCDEDALVRLLPHLTTADHSPTGDTMPTEHNGDSPEHVRDTLGLAEGELAAALQHAGLPAPEADTEDGASTPETTARTRNADGIEALLAWAQTHTLAALRNRAARVRSDLNERRAADAAQREAEERVAKAKAELEAAQAQLRQVKSGGRVATEDQAATTPLAPAHALGGKRSKEELAAIRTWARAHGHQVAERGNPAKAVLDAYDAAHRTDTLAEAS
ncbi:histone-like nucleoid-structuring protein Lsr2 [Streptomyces sp. NPDC052114]|uniref:Lsr2 family DNA-binding protein n=1 Tax=unclassified Streptomyces TaxID=2593676 RepID=UPI0034335809